MIITWDEIKRVTNSTKHGLDFGDLSLDYFAGAVVVPARGRRFRAIGLFGERLISVVFATLGTEAVSIISMRPASKEERRRFDDFQKGH